MKDRAISIRVPSERLERIDARAKAAGLTRTQYLLDRGDPEGAPKRATTPEDQARPTVACRHPRSARKVLQFGSWCDTNAGGCGARVG